jgi:outer membrane protein OmpA-like peptidoglycan-associated protein
MRTTPSRWLLVLSLLSATLAACRFSASASGQADTATGVDGSMRASAEGQAAVATEQPPPPAASSRSIEYKQGKLEYEGVINFEYDKAHLRSDATTQKTLGDFEKFLKDHPNVTLEIEGHTDSRGSDEYNRDLSERRAHALRDWLVSKGIAAERLTAVGKGESEPQTPEPPECKNKHPVNTTPCEAAWATNRRVVFSVTGGGEELEREQEPVAAPEPVPPPAPSAPPARECPWLWGGHVNALGPNSWAMLAGATQPGVCWLELSLGAGLGLGSRDASFQGVDADGRYWSLTVPLRGRIWFMDRHSLLGDVGIGFTHYGITADADDNAGESLDYRRSTTPLIGHLGVGYGYRPNGPQAGFRLAVIVGALVHLTSLGDSSVNAGFAAPLGPGLQGALDSETNKLDDLEPYGEVSFGWLF